MHVGPTEFPFDHLAISGAIFIHIDIQVQVTLGTPDIQVNLLSNFLLI